MKLSELEDSDQLATKAYLDQKLVELELRISDRLIASERAQRLWIWGLYGLIIVSFFVHK